VIRPPRSMGAFQFVALSALRAAQLTRGCRPRVEGTHKAIVTAQMEVAEGKIAEAPPSADGPAGAELVALAPAEADAMPTI